MDVIKKIEQMRTERNWSINYLATEAMLTQSTLGSMYKRGTPPKIDTLKNICAAFGITLSQFFCEDELLYPLTSEERELIDLYHKLPPEKKTAALMLLKNN